MMDKAKEPTLVERLERMERFAQKAAQSLGFGDIPDCCDAAQHLADIKEIRKRLEEAHADD